MRKMSLGLGMSIEFRIYVDTFIALPSCSREPTMETCRLVWVVLPLRSVIRDISVAKNQTETCPGSVLIR